MFFGECKVEIISKTRGAEILLDGILAGHNSVKASVPCGEKQVRVELHGYTPYLAYMPVTVDQPLKVTVELEHYKATPDYALSSRLIDQVRRGRKLNENPNAPDEPEAVEIASAAAPSAAAATAPTQAAASAPGTFSTNVEDWR